MPALLTALVALVFAAPVGDLDEVLKQLEATKSSPFSDRRVWVDKLCGFQELRARQAALDWYRREENPVLKARFLDHAAPLPRLSSKFDLDRTMLGELESGAGLPIRLVAARYFVEQRGTEGIGLCVALAGEKRDPELHQAVLAALGWQPAGTRAASVFAQRWKAAPPTTRHTVLIQLRQRKGSHLDRVRRAALKDPYLKLRGEAMAQLAAHGDKAAVDLARKSTKGREAATLAPIVFEILARAPRPADLPVMGALLQHRSSRMRRLVGEAVRRLQGQDWVRTWALEDGRAHRDRYVRSFALHFLTTMEGPPVLAALHDLVGDADPSNRRRAVSALASRGDRRMVPLLEKQLERGKIDDKLDALEALDRILGEEEPFRVRLVDLATSGPAELRLLAIDLAGRHGMRQLLSLTASLIAHRDWRVRAAGIRYARRVRDASTVPLLIRALAREKGRLAEDIRQALAALTRLYFQRPVDWQRWWEGERGKFVLPPPEQEVETPMRTAPTTPEAATAAVFYGIPVTSERVIYCLDVSGSMARAVGTGTTRLKIARETLLQALAKSPDQSLVNVLFFDNRVRPYSKKMVSLQGGKQRERLATFIRAQKALGGTNIYDSLMRALDDRRVDTIFLLSDGDPTEGDITDPTELADDIGRRNRGRGVLIHTVAIGGPSSLLQRLAAESGGRYVVQK